MNILVTGGSGYIGNYVVKELLDNNHNVSIVCRKENQFIKDYSDKTTVYFQDITEQFSFEPKHNYDLVIHLGAANDIDSKDPSFAINATVLGTKNTLEFCVKQNINKIIYFSTFQVYGYVEGDMDENGKLLPTNDYGLTHLFAEEYIEMYQRTKGIDFITIRPTNIFGTPMYKTTDRWSLVPSCFCQEALTKNEINLLSSGKQVRDFVSVKDIASTTRILAEQFNEYKNQPINISSGFNYTIVEVAEMVKEQFQSLYNEKCELNIHSEEPIKENEFYLCRKKVNRLEFNFGGKDNMIDEINNIFNILK